LYGSGIVYNYRAAIITTVISPVSTVITAIVRIRIIIKSVWIVESPSKSYAEMWTVKLKGKITVPIISWTVISVKWRCIPRTEMIRIVIMMLHSTVRSPNMSVMRQINSIIQVPLLRFIIFKVVLFGIIPAIFVAKYIVILIYYLTLSLLNRSTAIRCRLSGSRIIASI